MANKKQNKSKTVRQPFDQYFTPSWCVERFLEKIQLPKNGIWLEPCGGNGAIVDAVNKFVNKTYFNNVADGQVLQWKIVEIQNNLKTELLTKTDSNNIFIKDFTTLTLSELGVNPSVVITNPPYTKAIEFIKKSMELKPDYICMLLRVNFLASHDRVDFFHNHKPSGLFVLPNRPCFVGNNGDMTEYAWYLWNLKDGYNAKPGTQRLEVLDDTPVHVRKPKKVKKVKDIFTPLTDNELKEYNNSKEAKAFKKELKKAIKEGEENIRKIRNKTGYSVKSKEIIATITEHVKL